VVKRRQHSIAVDAYVTNFSILLFNDYLLEMTSPQVPTALLYGFPSTAQ